MHAHPSKIQKFRIMAVNARRQRKEDDPMADTDTPAALRDFLLPKMQGIYEEFGIEGVEHTLRKAGGDKYRQALLVVAKRAKSQELLDLYKDLFPRKGAGAGGGGAGRAPQEVVKANGESRAVISCLPIGAKAGSLIRKKLIHIDGIPAIVLTVEDPSDAQHAG